MVSRVYDASVFYAGVPFASQEQGCTTSLIYEEIKHIKHSVLETLLDTGRLKIIDPESEAITFVIESSKKTGDYQKLSKADVSAIALAFQLKVQLVTDDFAVSNLAKNIGLDIVPIMTNGIKIVGKWVYYCPACKKEFSALAVCPNCGNTLRYKLLHGKSF